MGLPADGPDCDEGLSKPMGSIADRGMVVAFCGPDGTGKTTVTSSLIEHLDAPVVHIHHRPEVLPYPTPDATRDFTQPHVGESHTRLRSLFKVLYLYLDWLLAWALRIGPHRRKGGWVIIQRPWWDMLVDPLRYRLDISPWVLRFLGRLMPSPDLTVLLEGSPSVIRARKPELSEEQIQQQAAAWREVISAVGGIVVDVDRPVDSCVSDVMKAARAHATGDRLNLGSIRDGNWLLPRKPAGAALAAVGIYQPMNRRGRAVRLLAQIGAISGMTRFMPRGEIPEKLYEAIWQWLPERGTIAARWLRRGRWFVLVIGGDGRPTSALKVALTSEARKSIARERAALEVVEPLMGSPVMVPELREASDSALVMRPVGWKAPKRPLELPEEVAGALGTIFASTKGWNGEVLRGRVHGDFAPWNVLWDGRQWVILDWEESRPDGPPFYDIFHFFVQCHSIMGRPAAAEIIDGMRGSGPVAVALEAFARGAGIDPSLSREYFDAYLRISADWLDPSERLYRTGIAKRRALQDLWADRIGAAS